MLLTESVGSLFDFSAAAIVFAATFSQPQKAERRVAPAVR
jgi:hypothetical protein